SIASSPTFARQDTSGYLTSRPTVAPSITSRLPPTTGFRDVASCVFPSPIMPTGVSFLLTLFFFGDFLEELRFVLFFTDFFTGVFLTVFFFVGAGISFSCYVLKVSRISGCERLEKFTSSIFW